MSTPDPLPGSWDERPVFLSSTFGDMQAERDHLMSVVFPELAERLRANAHLLLPIDLRWGVETLARRRPGETAEHEQARLALEVLRHCLEAIDRARPFVIVLFGDRSGWAPEVGLLRSAAYEAGLGFLDIAAGASVTELEIEAGVFACADRLTRSWFYFREDVPYDQMSEPQRAVYQTPPDSPAGAALSRLKQRVRERFPDRCRTYRAGWDGAKVAGLEDFGRMVVEDLWRDLDEHCRFARIRAPRAWPEAERATLAEFVDERGRGFVGREQAVDELVEDALSNPDGGPGTVVVGPPGRGKSSLFARLHVRLQPRLLLKGRRPAHRSITPADRRLADRLDALGVLVLSHAFGISPRSTNFLAVLRRWVGELALTLGVPEPLGDDSDRDAAEAAFARLLRAGSEGTADRPPRRIVLLLDGIDQTDASPYTAAFHWLPAPPPPNVRVIATGTPGPAAERLAERLRLGRRELPPLNQGEVEDIVRGVCAAAHKDVSPTVLALLLSKAGPEGAAAGNPLWLSLAVGELLWLNQQDFEKTCEPRFAGLTEDAKLVAVQREIVSELPGDVTELYGWLLERAEGVAGGGLARRFATLVALSRFGLRESDLRNLLPAAMAGGRWDDLRFARLRRTFQSHLVRRGEPERFDFFHAQMRLAVRSRYLTDPAAVRAAHADLARHFLRLPPDDPFHETETVVHLLGARKRRATARYLSGRRTPAELAGATLALADHVRGHERGAGRVAQLLDAVRGRRRSALARLLAWDVQRTLENENQFAARVRLLHAAAAAWKELLRANGRSHGPQSLAAYILDAHRGLGRIAFETGDIEAARKNFETHRVYAPFLAELEGHAVMRCLEQLAVIARREGKFEAAGRLLRERLAFHERDAGFLPESQLQQTHLAEALRDLGNLHEAREQLGEARTCYRRAEQILARFPDVTPDAERYEDRTLLDMRILIWIDLGDVALAEGDLSEAKRYCARVEAVTRQQAHNRPGDLRALRDLSRALYRLARVAAREGDLPASHRHDEEVLRIRARVYRATPDDQEVMREYAVALNAAAGRAHSAGDYETAMTLCRESIAIRRRILACQPTAIEPYRDLLAALQNFYQLLRRLGRTDDAERTLEEIFQALRKMQEQGLSIPPQYEAALRRANQEREAEDLLRRATAAFQHAAELVDGTPGALAEFVTVVDLLRDYRATRPDDREAGQLLVSAQLKLAALYRTHLGEGHFEAMLAQCHDTLVDLQARGFDLDPAMAKMLQTLDRFFDDSDDN